MTKKIFKDQKGSILPITAAVMFVCIAIVAVIVDFGRYAAAKEQLETASSAAALAGAKTGYRYVQLEINRGRKYVKCPKDVDGPCCESCGNPIRVSGREEDLIDNSGWRRYCCSCGCGSYKILDRWIEYDRPSDVYAATHFLFEANKPKEMEPYTGGSAYISNFSYRDGRNESSYVIVETQGKIKTLMMNFFKIISPDLDFTYLNAHTCSQGATYYKDVDTGKWNRPPDSRCKE